MSELGEITVSIGALRGNAEALRALVAPSRAAFVVKSNAYGHGLSDVALAIEPLAAMICVYTIEEALELRDDGITKPILILGPVPQDAISDALAAKFHLTLWDTHAYLQAITSAAHKLHTTANVHIKLNTGVNRYGLEPNDLPDALETFCKKPELHIAGIFSHLASAEEIDSPYTDYQRVQFVRALDASRALLDAAHMSPTRHLAASAAAMLYPQTRFDMVRFGIALYGLWPSSAVRAAMTDAGLSLHPVLSYTSSLAAVRDVVAGSAIGYGGTYHAPRSMRIGVVPLGYADGIPRLLSNIGEFLVDGKPCPIIGRVAMNATLLDLSNAPQAHPGSPVTLIGRDGEHEVTADDWATWAQSINYEVVARLPERISRRFLQA